jgi:hypothetical protein
LDLWPLLAFPPLFRSLGLLFGPGPLLWLRFTVHLPLPGHFFAAFPFRLPAGLFLPFPFQALFFQSLFLRLQARIPLGGQPPGALAFVAFLIQAVILGVLAFVIAVVVIGAALKERRVQGHASGDRHGQGQKNYGHRISHNRTS